MQNKLIAFMAILISTAFMPSAAFALEPVANMGDTIVTFMTGPFARIAGAIAIAFIGYRWFSGRLELGRALTIAGGIVLVLGAPAIVDFIDAGI